MTRPSRSKSARLARRTRILRSGVTVSEASVEAFVGSPERPSIINSLREGKMDELIKCLEAAESPSYDLDARIYCAVNALTYGTHTMLTPRPYTASIDIALTLIPKGCDWHIEPDGAWVHWMGKNDVEEAQCVLIGRDGKCTPIAICVAAFKARRAHQQSGDAAK
jgi:hypothetical protein